MTEKEHIPIGDSSSSHSNLDRVVSEDAMIDHPSDTRGIFDDFSPQVVSLYENLLEQEAAPADPNEVIHVGLVRVDSPEWAHLLQVGVSPSTLESGSLTRGILLDAGFAFMNKIGGGEKSLIATTIEMDDGSVVDTRRRTLLTASELDAVQRSQNSLNEANNEHIRLAMIDFLQASKEVKRLEPEIKKAMFQDAQKRILDSGNEENIMLIGSLFRSIIESGDNRKLAFMIDHCAAGLDIAKVGGIPIDMFASRSSALHGVPSPFLDSGYHFDTNDDVTIYPDDPTKTRRLNSVVVHLLSRGLNEQGGSTNNSHDQTYITSREFKELIESLDESDSGLYDDKTIEIFTARLLKNAEQEESL